MELKLLDQEGKASCILGPEGSMSFPIRNMRPSFGPMPTHLLVQQFCTTQQFALMMAYYQLDLLSVLMHTVQLIFQLYLEY